VLLIVNLFTDKIANINKICIIGMAAIFTQLMFICVGMHVKIYATYVHLYL
jgi:hypothetical protein